MKKYKVVTDNLDWYHLPKGRIVAVTSPGEFEGGINHFQQTIEECMLLHPDWFEEVKENVFTRNDMVDFAFHYFCQPHAGPRMYIYESLDEWIKFKNS